MLMNASIALRGLDLRHALSILPSILHTHAHAGTHACDTDVGS